MDRPPSLEYIAGFFDGEGSVGYYTKPQRQLVVNIAQSDRAILQDIARGLGIDAQPIRNTPGPEIRNGDKVYKRKPSWHLQLYGDRAAAVLEALLPHLRLKRERALAALDAWRRGGGAVGARMEPLPLREGTQEPLL